MVVYQLSCPSHHVFEGWFASPEACEREASQGRLSCPTCASAEIRKLPAAPHVHTSAPATAQAPDEKRLRAIVHAEAVKLVRRAILENTQDVGPAFPEVARRMHYKEEEARAIRGVTTREESDALKEEGIETVAIPAGLLPADELH